jgi:hypothetical protein
MITVQASAHVYACETSNEANIASADVDWARRIAVNVAKLPLLLGKGQNE